MKYYNIQGNTLEEWVYKLQRCYTGGNLDKSIMYEVINKLLKRFGNGKETRDLSPITIEIAMDNKEEVIKLLEKGVDVNEINELGMTPLSTAIYFNNLELASLLIEKGADVNFNWKGIFTLLMLACEKHNDKMVKLLLEKGAKVNEIDGSGYNALHHLVNNGRITGLENYFREWHLMELEVAFSNQFKKIDNPAMSRVTCIDLLVNNGIDINYRNPENGINALSIALEGNGSGYTKILDRLIKLGAERKAVEISPCEIYSYQASFDFVYDIKNSDISLWPDAPMEYIHFLEYRRRIKKYGIEVYSKDFDDGYRRPKLIRSLQPGSK